MPGSVYQRKDGRWVAAISLAGKRTTKYAATEAEAREYLARLLPAPSIPATLTLAAWAQRWYLLKAAEVRLITVRSYQRWLTPLLPVIGSIPLAELTGLDIATAVARLHRQGKRHAVYAFTTLRTMLDDAVRLKVLAENPMTGLKKPRWSLRPRSYWTVVEAQQALQVMLIPHPHQKYRPLLALLLLTGIRIGEANALTWECLSGTTLRVEASTYFIHQQGWVTESPKNASSRRTISLTPTLHEVLSSLPLPHTGPIFRSTGGLPIGSSRINEALRYLCRDAGVPVINPHGLRHVHTILTIQATGDVHAAQRRLGHSNVSTTMRMYGYAHTSDREVSASLDRLLGIGDTDE